MVRGEAHPSGSFREGLWLVPWRTYPPIERSDSRDISIAARRLWSTATSSIERPRRRQIALLVLQQLNPAAEPLIVRAALLAPEPIPLYLFAEAREKFGELLATALAGDSLDEAVAALRTFALVDRETIVDERDVSRATDAIRLHRLVREFAAERSTGETREPLRRALPAALTAVYPDDGAENPVSWPRCALLTPHGSARQRWLTSLKVLKVPASSTEQARIFMAAQPIRRRARYSSARWPSVRRGSALGAERK
jgi:hypothetical protein